jgi:soluble lytic murein transglycosylase
MTIIHFAVKTINRLCLWGICLLFIPSSSVYASIWLQQRWHFKEAYQAILTQDFNAFKQLSTKLNHYPITHYLQYFYLKNTFEQENNQIILDFLKQYSTSQISQLLRTEWLTYLAKQGDWETFLTAYQPQKNTILQCYFWQARINTKQTNNVGNAVKELWLVGQSQPSACDPLFNSLFEEGYITDELRWQRIHLAMAKGNSGLVNYLAKTLTSETYKKWVSRWQAMHTDPATTIKNFNYSDSPLAQEILLYGLKRLANKDLDKAHQAWSELQKKYAFQSSAKAEFSRYLALSGAQQNHPQAGVWLATIDKHFADKKLNQARLQVALAHQDWSAVLELIQALPKANSSEYQWQYWQARALEQNGKTEAAEQLFQDLSQHRHYYGFLAAERLGKPYHFQAQVLKIDPQVQDQLLEQQTGLLRARELYFVGLADYARAEWQAGLSTLSTAELKTAALLAHQWGWHDRAIVTIAKANYDDDLKIRFPLPFYDTVLTHAQNQNLESEWVYGIIRQESAFQTDAVSSAGALGLMQLMPATAREVANRQKIELKNNEDILAPDINIQLGTSYLRTLLDRFNNNHLLATVAYNAGPTRVKRWLRQYPCFSPDVWIELIPFNQTRDYIQRVLSYTPIFESQMVKHQKVKPMLLESIAGEDC